MKSLHVTSLPVTSLSVTSNTIAMLLSVMSKDTLCITTVHFIIIIALSISSHYSPILQCEMIAYIMRFALRIVVNKDLVRELILLKEGTYRRGLGVLDIHVMLPSRIAEINIPDADFVFPS
jgi:hypothetical protein